MPHGLNGTPLNILISPPVSILLEQRPVGMEGLGRGRAATLPAWMSRGAEGPRPPGPPVDSEVEQVAMAAVLRDQDADLRAALGTQQCVPACYTL